MCQIKDTVWTIRQRLIMEWVKILLFVSHCVVAASWHFHHILFEFWDHFLWQKGPIDKNIEKWGSMVLINILKIIYIYIYIRGKNLVRFQLQLILTILFRPFGLLTLKDIFRFLDILTLLFISFNLCLSVKLESLLFSFTPLKWVLK